MAERECPLGHNRETNCPYKSCEFAQSCMAPRVGHLEGMKIVRAGGRNRHERRANEARRRHGEPMTAPVEIVYG